MIMTRTFGLVARTLAGLALGAWAIGFSAAAFAEDQGQSDQRKMELSSTTFADGGVLPISMIFESPNSAGANVVLLSSIFL